MSSQRMSRAPQHAPVAPRAAQTSAQGPALSSSGDGFTPAHAAAAQAGGMGMSDVREAIGALPGAGGLLAGAAAGMVSGATTPVSAPPMLGGWAGALGATEAGAGALIQAGVGAGGALTQGMGETSNGFMDTFADIGVAAWENAFGILPLLHFELRDYMNGEPASYEELTAADTEWKKLPDWMVGSHDNGDDAKELKYVHPDGREWDPLESTCRHASLSIL